MKYQEQPSASIDTFELELPGGLFDKLSHLLLVDNLGKRRFDRLGLGLGTEYLLCALDHRFIKPEMLGGLFRCGLQGPSFLHVYTLYRYVATSQGKSCFIFYQRGISPRSAWTFLPVCPAAE